MAALLPPLVLESTLSVSSPKLELNGTLQVLILVLCINFWVLLSSISLTAQASTWLDVLGLQWYWLSSSLDLTGSLNLAIGQIWAIHLCCSLLCLSSYLHLTGTAADVIHSIAWPHLLLRFDVCPGRISSLSCHAPFAGMVSGQCSELCGSLHGFMAISLEELAYPYQRSKISRFLRNPCARFSGYTCKRKEKQLISSLRVTRLFAGLVILSVSTWALYSVLALIMQDPGWMPALLGFLLLETMELIVLLNLAVQVWA